jgi:type VI protein secretion system component VasK
MLIRSTVVVVAWAVWLAMPDVFKALPPVVMWTSLGVLGLIVLGLLAWVAVCTVRHVQADDDKEEEEKKASDMTM